MRHDPREAMEWGAGRYAKGRVCFGEEKGLLLF